MPDLYLALVSLYIFFIGAILGSFFNVIIERLPNGESFVKGRSHCVHCGVYLKWYDLIPLLSYAFLKGRCRYCNKRLTSQYAISEMVIGSLSFLAFYRYGLHLAYAQMLVLFVLWSMLYVVSMIDIKHHIVMDSVLLAFTTVGVLISLLVGMPFTPLLTGGLVGLVFYGTIYGIARIAYKQEGFGAGDVLFLTAVGFFLGPEKTLLTGMMAFYYCLIFIVLAYVRERKLSKSQEFPFCPSIALAAFTTSIFGDSLLVYLMSTLGIG